MDEVKCLFLVLIIVLSTAEDHREAEQGGDHRPDVGQGAVLDEPALLPEPRGRREGEPGRGGATNPSHRGRQLSRQGLADVNAQRP